MVGAYAPPLWFGVVNKTPLFLSQRQEEPSLLHGIASNARGGVETPAMGEAEGSNVGLIATPSC
jgi:hypothetical protein